MDLILFNGTIRTMDSLNNLAQAISISDGRIIKVGSDADVLKTVKPGAQLIDLKKKLVLPGFHDSHLHLLNYAITLDNINLSSVSSVEDLIFVSSKFLSEKELDSVETETVRWVFGRGWNQNNWEKKDMPDRYDLDKISLTIPLVLTRVCGHIAVANSKALELLGLSKQSRFVEGGKIEVDKDGIPTGIFAENALDILYEQLEPMSVDVIKKKILFAAGKLVESGITAVQSDDLRSGTDEWEDVLNAFIELSNERELPIRVYEQCSLPSIDILKDFTNKGYKTGQDFGAFKIGPLKLLADGSLGGRTAYLPKPYADNPYTRGIPCYSQDQLDELVTYADENDMQIAVHCIGDAAMKMVLGAYDKIEIIGKKRNGIIHCQIMTDEIINEMAQRGIIAYIQPVFTNTDWKMAEDRIGKDSSMALYPWNYLREAGVLITLGTDAPVESFDPIANIYCAVTREDLSGEPKGGWVPKEKLTVEDAVIGYTLNSAIACFSESEMGTLEEGKLGDLVVLTEDIFEISPEHIRNAKVDMTVINGKVAFSR